VAEQQAAGFSPRPELVGWREVGVERVFSRVHARAYAHESLGGFAAFCLGGMMARRVVEVRAYARRGRVSDRLSGGGAWGGGLA